ncbi:MAG: hypothetical protein IPL26_13100 [Leptospiraceae bacterium]|nr:hypothetical protein [Leptospiraceae bacterium]
MNVTSTTITVKSNSSNTFGILEIFGDLHIDATRTLFLGRVLLIVWEYYRQWHYIRISRREWGGNGRSAGGGGGGGGNGNSVNIICFGTIAATLTIQSGIGGTGGAAAQVTNDAGSSALVDFGGAGGTVVAAANNGGGGGGGIGNGGNGANAGTSATTGGDGAGGGGGSSTATTGANGGIVTGLNTIWMSGSTGGKGGNGGGSPQKGTDGATGNVFLYSRYTSAPCTVTTSYGTSDGATGIAVYNELAQMSYLWGLLNSSFLYSSKSGAAV